jgi:hypothetical protein
LNQIIGIAHSSFDFQNGFLPVRDYGP